MRCRLQYRRIDFILFSAICAKLTNATGGNGGVACNLHNVAPIITTTTLPNGTQTVAYTTTLAGTTSPVNDGLTWSVSGSLPGGLTLTASSGVIAGTPSASGTFTFTVVATDNVNGQTASMPLSLTIAAGTACTKVITSSLSESVTFTQAVTVTYAMVGGGGGDASGSPSRGDGGGGWGGGGAGNYGNAGSSGANGTAGNCSQASSYQLGANTWTTATTLPSAAGLGGYTAGTQNSCGGNAGLVILTYTAATCAVQ